MDPERTALVEAMAAYCKVKDIDKVPPPQRDLVVEYEKEAVAFFNGYTAWMTARKPPLAINGSSDSFLGFLSRIANLTKMCEYVITDSPMNIAANTHIRNHDRYKACHFCMCEVSNSPATQRHKMVYSKKTKVQTEAFYVVCQDCLRYVKAMHNLRNVINFVVDAASSSGLDSDVELALDTLDANHDLAERVFDILKVMAADFDLKQKEDPPKQ